MPHLEWRSAAEMALGQRSGHRPGRAIRSRRPGAVFLASVAPAAARGRGVQPSGIVAKAANLRLRIYNNPVTTYFTLSSGVIARLSRVPRIAGMKNPAPGAKDVRGHPGALRAGTQEGFSLGCGVG